MIYYPSLLLLVPVDCFLQRKTESHVTENTTGFGNKEVSRQTVGVSESLNLLSGLRAYDTLHMITFNCIHERLMFVMYTG